MSKRVTMFLCLIAKLFICFVLITHAQEVPEPSISKTEERSASVWFSVTDPQYHFFPGLEKVHCRIYEDKVEQYIIHFSMQTEPISLGILWDISGSMRMNENVLKAKEAIARLLKAVAFEDECYLIAFNKNIKMLQANEDPLFVLRNEELNKKAVGATALFDSIHLGIERLKSVKHARKVIFVFSDGEDNSSRHSYKDICEFAKRGNVQINFVAMPGEMGYGRYKIRELAGITGGRVYNLRQFLDSNYSIDFIKQELHRQYLLRYVPTNQKNDGKWRKIKIKFTLPKDFPKLTMYAREGYYPPKDQSD